jgi:hypothetical protein
MSDFAMIDINDIFLYSASTEGTGTYTDYTVDRNGSVSDNVQLNPGQANRIRGISSANQSLGNIETMGRTPVDSMFLDSVEISRGPNASVFGLGQSSGTLNMVPVSANLTRNKLHVELRTDSYDGYRGGLDVNQVIMKNKLAVRVVALGNHEGFIRKPSGLNTVRYAVMGKFKPFKSTTISASIESYRMNGNRPNYTPPRDNISYWKSQGSPTWDPVAQVIHVKGTTLGPFTSSTGVPDYFTNSFTGSTHSVAFVDQNGLGYWGNQASTTNVLPLWDAKMATVTLNPKTDTRRYMAPTSASGVSGGRFTTQPLFVTTPTVSDKSIYDWEDINYAAVNRIMDKTITSNVQLDQFIIDTPKNQLVAQMSFMREDSTRYTRNLIGAANDNGQSGQLFIDVNEKLLDGSTNPYFLRPYIGTDQPRTTWEPAKWDTYRAQLMYKLDFSRDNGFTKWLGVHQLSGYDEYKYRVSKRYSYRDAMTSNPTIGGVPMFAAGTSRGNQSAVSNGAGVAPQLSRMYYRYYLGDASGNNIDYAPTNFKYGTYNYVWGGAAGFNTTPIDIGQVAVTDASGGASNTKTILKTKGGVLHSQWLNGLVVTTFGVRQDRQYTEKGSTPQKLLSDGITFDMTSIDHWAGPWKYYTGRTKQAGVVVRPFRDLPFISRMDSQPGVGGFIGELLKGMSFSMNNSDSFIPMEPKVSVFLKPLPNTTGDGKDRGVMLSLFNNKMFIRYNHYKTVQYNAQNGDASTIAGRVVRFDIYDDKDYRLPTLLTTWVSAQNPSWTSDQVSKQVSSTMGLNHDTRLAMYAAYAAGTIASTNDITAKGDELEVYFNPTQYWTISASATKTESIGSNVSKDIADYISQRMPYWTSIHSNLDPNAALWWNTKYGTNTQTPAENYAQFVSTTYAVTKQLEGKSNPQVRKYSFKISNSLQLAGFTDNKILKRFGVGGAVRWEDKGAIGYYGVQSLPAVITDLDASRPIYDKAHYYFDAFVSYKTKLWSDKVVAVFKLNVQNIQEGGRLQPIGAFPDGTIHTYRIVDPRKFILSASFDL